MFAAEVSRPHLGGLSTCLIGALELLLFFPSLGCFWTSIGVCAFVKNSSGNQTCKSFLAVLSVT